MTGSHWFSHPACPLWRSLTHAQKRFLAYQPRKCSGLQMSSAPTGFPRGKSGGSRPAHLSIPEREGRQKKFPGGPRRLSQYLEAVGRGRWLLPGFRATGVGAGSGAPSGGRPRGGAWGPAVRSQSGRGGASGIQMRSGWSRARTAAEKRGRSRREAQGARRPGHAAPVSSGRPDAGSRFVLSR